MSDGRAPFSSSYRAPRISDPERRLNSSSLDPRSTRTAQSSLWCPFKLEIRAQPVSRLHLSVEPFFCAYRNWPPLGLHPVCAARMAPMTNRQLCQNAKSATFAYRNLSALLLPAAIRNKDPWFSPGSFWKTPPLPSGGVFFLRQNRRFHPKILQLEYGPPHSSPYLEATFWLPA